MQLINKYYAYCFCTFIALYLCSCKKFVDVEAPSTQVNANNVYTTDATAAAVLTGLYSQLSAESPTPNISSGVESISLRCGLSADEFKLNDGNSTYLAFYKNELSHRCQ